MTFIKINKGDTVYDRENKIVGKVASIDYTRNTATVDTLEDNSTYSSNLYNLTVVEGVEEEEDTPLKIKIKYFSPNITKIEKISKGDWIDLRAAESVNLKAGEYKMIKLGVGMKLPEGYEANIVPRSSTFKNYGVIQTNHFAVIDNSYSGNEDQWRFPVYATKNTTINLDERICQFRIQERMPKIEIEEVAELDEVSRGGFGSTGIK